MINYEESDVNIISVDDFFKVEEILLETNVTMDPGFNRILKERDSYLKQYYHYIDYYEEFNKENVNEFEIVLGDYEYSEIIEAASFPIYLTDRIVSQNIDGNYFKMWDWNRYEWFSISEFDEKLEKNIKKILKARGFLQYATQEKFQKGIDEDEFNTLDDLINFYDAQESKKNLLELLDEL